MRHRSHLGWPGARGRVGLGQGPDAPIDAIAWLRKSGAAGVPLTSEVPQDLGPAGPPDGTLSPAQAVAAELSSMPLTVRYPWIYPPAAPASFPFVIANIPQNLNPAQTVNLIQFAEVPRGMAGVIQLFGNAAGDFTAIAWTFLVRGRPTPPITSLILNYGAINNPVRLPGSGIILGPGDDFILQASNIGAGIVANVQARVDGYLWQL